MKEAETTSHMEVKLGDKPSTIGNGMKTTATEGFGMVRREIPHTIGVGQE